MTTKLQRLCTEQGQSPWLDNLRRGWITGGELQAWVDKGIRGITSNPSIFQKAMGTGEDYDQQLAELAGQSIDDAYWALVVQDIEDALRILRPVYDTSDGLDGFVSVEVAPSLARDTDGTVAAARELHQRIAEPNLYVKIPGTAEGIPAIRQMIAEGHSINVTLIFSLSRYEEVMEAYISGLEAYDGDLHPVSSVASFFVSRVDTEVDRRLDEIGTPEALALRGKAAVAQAQVAYDIFVATFGGPRWEALSAAGRAGPASAVGLDLDQEPGLPRHPVRRLPHRPGDGQHRPRRHPRGLRGPRHRRPDHRRRPRRGAGGPGRHRSGRGRHGGRGPAPRGRGRGRVREGLRRAPRHPGHQGGAAQRLTR